MTIHIEVDDVILENTKKVFSDYGISVSEAINMFLDNVQKVKELPFEVEYKEPTKEKILNDLKEALNEVKLYEEGKIKLLDINEVLDEL
jgi:addiction module RelB/DinJ family antitoxin